MQTALRKRVISGCLLAAGLVLGLNYLPPAGMWALLVLVAVLGQLEFYGMVARAGIPVFRVVGALCGFLLITFTFWKPGGRGESVVLAATLIAVFVRQFPQKFNDKPLATIGCTLLGIWYVPYLLNFVTRLLFSWDDGAGHASLTGRILVLYLIVVVKMSDVGAYFFGLLLGRHKLFPRISPGKTWEGFFGGIAAAVLSSVALGHVLGWKLGKVALPLPEALLLGALLSSVGVVGDLFESLLKRATGMKDSGAVIPGMGGVLDVLDSLLFGAPVLYAYAALVMA